MIVPPDEVYDIILEHVAFKGMSNFNATLVQLESHIGAINQNEKPIIWRWVFNNPSKVVALTNDGAIIDSSRNFVDLVEQYGGDINIKLEDSLQFKYLSLGTEPASVTGFTLSLLQEIAKTGVDGIVTSQLTKVSGQDARSMTSRINRLIEAKLIQKKPIALAKHNTSLLIHVKFASKNPYFSDDSNQHLKDISDRIEARKTMVETLKSNNGNMDFFQLRDVLGLNSEGEKKRLYWRLIASLTEKGVIEREVIKNNDTQVTYVKLLKDLPSNDRPDLDLIDITGGSPDNGEENDDDPLKPDGTVTINRFHPFATQAYELANSSTTKGYVSMDLIRRFVGSSFSRSLTRQLEGVVIDHTSKAMQKSDNQIQIVRGYDFEGKKKFYRYFSKKGYLEMVGKPYEPQDFSSLKPLNVSLLDLNKKLRKPLTQSVEILDNTETGTKMLHWFGDSTILTAEQHNQLISIKRKKEANETGAKRGRPRKGEERTPIKKHKPEADEVPGDVSSSAVAAVTSVAVKSEEPSRAAESVAVSFKSVRRRKELVGLIEHNGGCMLADATLIKSLDARMKNSTVTDGRTFARDVSMLLQENTIVIETFKLMYKGTVYQRKLIKLNDVNEDSAVNLAKGKAVEAIRKSLTQFTGKTIISSDILEVTDQDIERLKEENLREKERREQIKRENREKRELLSLEPRSVRLPKLPTTRSLGRSTAAAGPVKRRSRKSKKVKEEEADGITPPIVQESIKDSGDADGMMSILPKKKSRKSVKKEPKALELDPITGKVRRIRIPLRFDKNDATTLYRAVVISRSFSPSGHVEWEKISELFHKIDANSLKKKWPLVRKALGGGDGVTRGIQQWEKILMKNIEDGIVSVNELETLDYEFFLHLWRNSDSSSIVEADETPIYIKIADNLEEYEFIDGKNVESDVSDFILSDASMIQKEIFLSRKFFSFNVDDTEITPKPHEDIRTLLKTIFLTGPDQFLSTHVRRILEEYKEEEVKETLTELLDDKEIAYYAVSEADTKFTITDKFHTALNGSLSTMFFKESNSYRDLIESVVSANKGLIVSLAIKDAQMSSLFQLLNQGKIGLTRVDRHLTGLFEGYESRSMEREKLDCDLIIDTGSNIFVDSDISNYAVPLGKAGEHIWLDINGEINGKLWSDLLSGIITHILFKPGVTVKAIYKKFQSILSLKDLRLILDWLIQCHGIRQGDFDGYWVKGDWYTMFGSI